MRHVVDDEARLSAIISVEALEQWLKGDLGGCLCALPPMGLGH